jgi:hypothetical protein
MSSLIYLSPKKISTLFWCTVWAWNWQIFWCTGWAWNWQIIFRFASIHGRAWFILIFTFHWMTGTILKVRRGNLIYSPIKNIRDQCLQNIAVPSSFHDNNIWCFLFFLLTIVLTVPCYLSTIFQSLDHYMWQLNFITKDLCLINQLYSRNVFVWKHDVFL